MKAFGLSVSESDGLAQPNRFELSHSTLHQFSELNDFCQRSRTGQENSQEREEDGEKSFLRQKNENQFKRVSQLKGIECRSTARKSKDFIQFIRALTAAEPAMKCKFWSLQLDMLSSEVGCTGLLVVCLVY